LDRSPETFSIILNALRSDQPLEIPSDEREEILLYKEIDYFGMRKYFGLDIKKEESTQVKSKVEKSEIIGILTSNGTKYEENLDYKKKLSGITVWGTSYFDGFQLIFNDGKDKSQIYGQSSGTPQDMILEKGEYFTKADVTYSSSDIYSLQLETNKGANKKFGGTGTSTKTVDLKKGLVNITCEVSTYPRKLQFHYKV
jgi:hypothetical protein